MILLAVQRLSPNKLFLATSVLFIRELFCYEPSSQRFGSAGGFFLLPGRIAGVSAFRFRHCSHPVTECKAGTVAGGTGRGVRRAACGEERRISFNVKDKRGDRGGGTSIGGGHVGGGDGTRGVFIALYAAVSAAARIVCSPREPVSCAIGRRRRRPAGSQTRKSKTV